MVNITKAIIHILNPEQGITIQSRNELDITSGTTYQYVNSLIEKAFNISQLKFGNFASNSTVLSLIRQYKNNESEFGEISRTISERMYESLSATEKSKDRIPSDVIVAEFIKDEVKYIAILKCENKVEYLHKVINSGEEVTVEIADINSILPPKTKVVTECAFIDLEKEEVFYKDKKYQIDGETAYIMSDIVLECICETASDKEVSSYITKALNKIYSDEPIQQIESAVKYKDFMIDNINKKNTKYTLNEVIGAPGLVYGPVNVFDFAIRIVLATSGASSGQRSSLMRAQYSSPTLRIITSMVAMSSSLPVKLNKCFGSVKVLKSDVKI